MAVDSATRVEGGSTDELREARRLEAVGALGILDTSREKPFDRIVRLVKAALGVDTALISFIDAHRQWHKASIGMDERQVPVQETFCRHVVKHEKPVIVPDARKDPRFANSRFVTAENGLRFYAGIPLKTRDGFVVGTLCAIDSKPHEFSRRDLDLLQDFATLVVDQLELRERAMTDDLTGALSRRALYEEGGRLAALASRHRHNLTAIAFDLDHFKSINDTYGHAAGDEVLKIVAKRILRNIRGFDTAARFGGEEFVVAMPDTPLDVAFTVADRIRVKVAEEPVTLPDGSPISVTLSAGVAESDPKGDTTADLIERADKALYIAKHEGRDMVIKAPPPPGAEADGNGAA